MVAPVPAQRKKGSGASKDEEVMRKVKELQRKKEELTKLKEQKEQQSKVGLCHCYTIHTCTMVQIKHPVQLRMYVYLMCMVAYS